MGGSETAELVDVGSARLECLRFGQASLPPLVIETSLGGSIAEWFPLVERLSTSWQVILYSRAGYGQSSPSSLDRTPFNVATELDRLLEQVMGDRPVTIIGHSYGGLIAQALVRIRADRVNKAIFIDPMTTQDRKFETELTAREFAASGVDKGPNLRLGRALCRLGLGWFFRPLLRRGPPFYYWPEYSPEATRIILRNATRYQMYHHALEEYRLARDPKSLGCLPGGEASYHGEAILFTHHSAGMEQDIRHYGATDTSTAAKVEALWQSYMREVLGLSPHSRHVQSRSGSHFLHLTDSGTLMGLVGC